MKEIYELEDYLDDLYEELRKRFDGYDSTLIEDFEEHERLMHQAWRDYEFSKNTSTS